jgi:hypothetical protein
MHHKINNSLIDKETLTHFVELGKVVEVKIKTMDKE